MSPMNRFGALLIASLILVCAVGCASNNTGKIEGTKWSSAPTTVDGTPIPAGAISLSFGADGSLSYIAGPKAFTGTYSLGMADYVTFKLNEELAGRKTHLERVKIEGSKLTLIDSDGSQLVFNKSS